MIDLNYTFEKRARLLSKYADYSVAFPYLNKRKTETIANNITIGQKTFPLSEFGQPMKINLEQALVGLILGQRGSGKSTLMKTILSEMWFGGYLVAVIPDTKNEYCICKEPIQQRFMRWVNPERRSMEFLSGIDTTSFSPLFLKIQNRGMQPKGTKLCQLDPKDADLNDWLKILNLDTSGLYAQKFAMESMWLRFFKMSSEQMMNTLNFLHEEYIAGVQKSSKEKLTERIRNILRMGYFGVKYKIKLEKELMDKIVVFVTEGSDMADPMMVNEFVAMILRKIYYFKRKYRSKRLVLFHEEANSIAPNMEYPPSKKETLHLVREGRSTGLYQFFNYQSLSDVPTLIKDQSGVCFFNKFFPQKNQEEVMDFFNIPFNMRLFHLDHPMKLSPSGIREWCMLENGKLHRFIAYLPTVALQLQGS